jgi:hypothetical protein
MRRVVLRTTTPGGNTCSLSYAPSPARFNVAASGWTSASQFYASVSPTANSNDVFNALLVELEGYSRRFGNRARATVGTPLRVKVAQHGAQRHGGRSFPLPSSAGLPKIDAFRLASFLRLECAMRKEFENLSAALDFVDTQIIKSKSRPAILQSIRGKTRHHWPLDAKAKEKPKKFVVFYNGGVLGAFIATEPKSLEQKPYVRFYYPDQPTKYHGFKLFDTSGLAEDAAEYNRFVDLDQDFAKVLERDARDYQNALQQGREEMERGHLSDLESMIYRVRKND